MTKTDIFKLKEKRMDERIENEIKKLEQEKENLPEYSFFGDPNHKIIDIQINILKGNLTQDEVWDMESDEFSSQAIGAALEAFHFLNGDIDSLTE